MSSINKQLDITFSRWQTSTPPPALIPTNVLSHLYACVWMCVFLDPFMSIEDIAKYDEGVAVAVAENNNYKTSTWRLCQCVTLAAWHMLLVVSQVLEVIGRKKYIFF